MEEAKRNLVTKHSPGPLYVLSPMLSSLNNTEMHMTWSLPSSSIVRSRRDKEMQERYNKKYNSTQITWLGSCWWCPGQGCVEKDAPELGMSVRWDQKNLGREMSLGMTGIRGQEDEASCLKESGTVTYNTKAPSPHNQGRDSK